MNVYSLGKPQFSNFSFLRDVHHTTLKEYVSAIWGWNEEQQDSFFRDDFETGQIQIISVAGEHVGYLQLNREENVLYIVNILILPKFQNRGLGVAIIKDLIAQSKKENRSIKLGVFKQNTRAKKLYENLNFKLYEETPTHYLMQLERT